MSDQQISETSAGNWGEGNASQATAGPSAVVRSGWRLPGELFLISLLILFLELACIRWFPAHVLFLTFFTNTVLLACFLGMSLGCLCAGRPRDYLRWTPALLGAALLAAQGVETWSALHARAGLRASVEVGNTTSPQLVFFGTEHSNQDVARFALPIEVLCGFFFLLIALAFIGPGQVLGRALQEVPDRVGAYSINILGSIVGIALFSLCSWCELGPVWWFLPVVLGLGYFLLRRPGNRLLIQGALLGLVLLAAGWDSGWELATPGEAQQHLWSPYYRIDYRPSPSRDIGVNLISHQQMVSRADSSSPGCAYALPYLLQRDARRVLGKGPSPFRDVLIIGAGSGNDVSRALQWGAEHVDAVEIDPVIQRLGARDHPDHPYQDRRVSVHHDDGRNFLRSTDRDYDLIVYALVDSLVLHSSYSNIRLESYLFTRQAFADVRRHLKPGGLFVMYNYFRQGWIVARLDRGLEEVFGASPLVLTLPYQQDVDPNQSFDGFTVLMAGDGAAPIREAFARHPDYWLSQNEVPSPRSPNGFEASPSGFRFGPARITRPEDLNTASDDWPFLYLRRPMIPALSVRGMAIMGGLALALLFLFLPRGQRDVGTRRLSVRMFFLGAGFMLIETRAVVNMALLFGSTWLVNSVVFFAVLVMILAANLFVIGFRPARVWPYYLGLLAALVLNALVPLDFFLGLGRWPQVIGSCLLVFTPILFAGMIFALSFRHSAEPDRVFGANIAGAMLGGLAEYASMVLGFQYLVLLALGFYALSAVPVEASAGAPAGNSPGA